MTLDKDPKHLLSLLKKVAKKRVEQERQFREFTGLIGELAICGLPGYTWKPDEGYDAIDKEDKKIQIKARRLQTSESLKQGRIGRFGSAKQIKDERGNCNEDKYEFEIGILVLLDKEFEIAEIWDLHWDEIQARESKEKESYRKSGKETETLPGLHLGAFIEKPARQHCHRDFPSVEKRLGLRK